MKRFKLVIFDLDGTLVDSSIDVIECFNYALKMEGLRTVSDDEIKRTIGYPLREALAQYGESDKLYNHFRVLSKQIMGNNTVLLNGVIDVLEKLSNNSIPVAIATTKVRQNTERILKILDIDKYISELSCADDVKNVKPAPDALLRLLEIFNINNKEALMVGDTVNDIVSARNAGIKSVAVLNGFDPEEKIKSEKPDWILNNLEGVLDIVLNGKS